MLNNKKKKRTCRLEDFVVPAEHQVKIKWNENINTFLDLARKLKKKTLEHDSDSDSNFSLCTCIVYWPLTRPKCHSKVMHRKEVTHSDGSYEKKSRRRAWLTIWDKVKSHGTLIDWCTRREWPVNCMTVISAWWRSNIPFERLSGRLNYYITR